MEFSCPNCHHLPEALGLYIPSDSNQVDMGDMDTGYPPEGDFDFDANQWRPRLPTLEPHGQHRATMDHGRHSSSPPYAPGTHSHHSFLAPLPSLDSAYDATVDINLVLPVGATGPQPNSPSRNASYRFYSPSTDSDATMVQHYHPPTPTSPGHELSPYTHRGGYIYAQATESYMPALVPALEAPPMDVYTPAADSRLLHPPTRTHRNRSGSLSSQHSHRSRESQSPTTHPDYPPYSQLHAGHTPAQTPHFLSPPPREHRRRSGSRSSSHSHRSEESHSSASHTRHSSRSGSQSPLPSLSYASPSPSSPSSTNLSFIQPSPNQPIILPIGQNGKNGYVVVPARGQDVTVIPVHCGVHYQSGWVGSHAQIEDVSSTANNPAPPTTKNRIKSLFSRKKK